MRIVSEKVVQSRALDYKIINKTGIKMATETDYAIIVSIENKNSKVVPEIRDVFKSYNVEIVNVETRPTPQRELTRDYLYIVRSTGGKVDEITEKLKSFSANVKIVSPDQEIWFPTEIDELDTFAHSVIPVEMPEDHPGQNDEKYKNRRQMFSEIAYNYKQ
ncbi:Protein henna [Nymphon striatum]|nr:Protein henna [Nymphon striatum]